MSRAYFIDFLRKSPTMWRYSAGINLKAFLMKTKGWLGLVFACMSVLTAKASTVVLNFDDIPGDVVPIPAGYGGVNWAPDMGVWSGFQDPYNPSSPPTRVLFNVNNEIGVAESKVTFIGGPHIFDGAYFDGSHTVTLKLYSGATLVKTVGPLTLNNVPTFLPSGYASPVDTIGILGDRSYISMDDFTYESVVPEPSTAGLLAIGLMAARFWFRGPRIFDGAYFDGSETVTVSLNLYSGATWSQRPDH